MIENGLNGEILLAGGYGHQLHIWDLPRRRHKQVIDLGAEQELVFEMRPAHDPTRAYGFVNVVTSLADLSASVWLWHLDGSEWAARKVISIPAEPADESQLPPILKPFKAVLPLVTDIDLSLDDRWLYVSCWGTGELTRFNVSDPFNPLETGSVRIGGIVRREAVGGSGPLVGGPQMVELSRDGQRVYLSNGLYRSWEDPLKARISGLGSLLAVAGAGAARRLPRSQSGHGLAVRCRTRAAGKQPGSGRGLARPDPDRP